MKASQGFSGFPSGVTKLTPIPAAFFTELLPAVDDLGELKITLHAFWLLGNKDGHFRCFRRDELLADARLLEGLAHSGLSGEEALDDALERAASRGTLIKVTGAGLDPDDAYYCLNSPKGRAAAKALEAGTWRPEADEHVMLQAERPNVYALYEQNIGPLTPMIAETLQEAETTYPASWIEEALQIAVHNNARKWAYVEAILKDWRTQGKDEREDRGDSEAARRRYVEGEFADFIEH